MKLLNQVVELNEELDKVLGGEGNSLAIKELAAIHGDIAPQFEVLEAAFNCRKLYKDLPDEYSITGQSEEEVTFSQSALLLVQEFIETWNGLEQKHKISQDDICSNVRDSIKRISKAIKVKNATQYQKWINQISAEVEVSETDLEQQENSPNLKENALRYRELRQRFSSDINTPLPTEITIKSLISLSKQLLDIKEKMEFNQPEDVVKLFKHLKQTGNSGRAPIAMLTPQVLEWMADKGQEDCFYIGDIRIGNR
jgi:hypothetical protein